MPPRGSRDVPLGGARSAQPAPRKPTTIASSAVLRVEPTGPRSRVPRDYLIAIQLWPSAPATATLADARALAAGSLSGVMSSTTATDGPTVRELAAPAVRDAPQPPPTGGVEGVVLCADWPARARIADIRTALLEHGYEVTVEQRLACAEPGCTAEAELPWAHTERRPRDWYSERICGRHNYRACAGCGSVFRLVSVNASGPAPSLPCPICQVLLVEWGGTKRWEAELVRRTPDGSTNHGEGNGV